ncbi:MAG TPA: hypothetical protein VFG84_06885 [Gemmatimonadaceae bacterium]|nr:hypothetical protein [Gemmatimonadaceae bacterium]
MTRPALAMLLGACLTSMACAGAVRQEPDAVDLAIAATTDVHGRLIGWDYNAERPDTACDAMQRWCIPVRRRSGSS